MNDQKLLPTRCKAVIDYLEKNKDREVIIKDIIRDLKLSRHKLKPVLKILKSHKVITIPSNLNDMRTKPVFLNKNIDDIFEQFMLDLNN